MYYRLFFGNIFSQRHILLNSISLGTGFIPFLYRFVCFGITRGLSSYITHFIGRPKSWNLTLLLSQNGNVVLSFPLH